MPAYIRLLTPVGLQPAPYAADSLADAVRYEPADGVYTVTNTCHLTQVLKIDAHLDRMEDSARRAEIPLMLDRARLRAALRQMIQDAGFGDVRFRVTVPRQTPDHLILTLEPFVPPAPEVVHAGVRCITAPDSARQNAAAKTTGWMHRRKQFADAMPPGIYDTILQDQQGYLLEGLASNFYAVLGDELRTAGSGVLPGIAQQIVFEVAPELLSVRREAVHVSAIPRLQEAFITSSSRGIIPVVEIDAVRLGDGTPGERTRALQALYNAWVQRHLEEL